MFNLEELQILKELIEEKATFEMDVHMHLGTSLKDVREKLAPYARVAQKVHAAMDYQNAKKSEPEPEKDGQGNIKIGGWEGEKQPPTFLSGE